MMMHCLRKWSSSLLVFASQIDTRLIAYLILPLLSYCPTNKFDAYIHVSYMYIHVCLQARFGFTSWANIWDSRIIVYSSWINKYLIFSLFKKNQSVNSISRDLLFIRFVHFVRMGTSTSFSRNHARINIFITRTKWNKRLVFDFIRCRTVRSRISCANISCP